MNPAAEDSGVTTVLIVDDDRQLADVFEQSLSETYNTRTAYDGEEALEEIADEVDVVLLDRRMPKMSGGEVLTAFRDRGCEQPVAMLTAVYPDEDILELAVDDYFVKPLSIDKLHEVVETLAARKQYDETMRKYFAAVSKKASLEATMSEEELASSETYSKLEQVVQAAKENAEEARSEVIAEDASGGFRDV